ncbi:MAG: S8 family serine peptidase [Deltaproteobacteria bacterium]|jgi:serine protease
MVKGTAVAALLREVDDPNEEQGLREVIDRLVQKLKPYGVLSGTFLVENRDEVKAMRDLARQRIRQSPRQAAGAPLDVIEATTRVARYAIFDVATDRNLDDIVDVIRNDSLVAQAFAQEGLKPAALPIPFSDTVLANQVHLKPAAPDAGVDAYTAWCVPGGLGEGAQCLVLDAGGWQGLESGGGHPDLSHFSFLTGFATSGTTSGDHGTQAAGTGFAQVDGSYAVGVAPQVSNPRAATVTSESAMVAAMTAAASTLQPGDVVVIPLALVINGGPVEMDPSVYAAIVSLTGLGIIVVEAAGNEGDDLDWLTFGGAPVLHPTAGHADSKAIIVGGSGWLDPTTFDVVPLHQWQDSNYGARVTVFSWALGVEASAHNGMTWNTAEFQGTSSASSIIGGVAVALQSIKKAFDGVPYSPSQLRTLLSDPTLNTAAVGSTAWPFPKIGVQPNLGAIIANQFPTYELGDAYARDNVTDIGIAHSGPLSSSPDILYATSVPVDPEASWGAGSGNENAYVGGSVDPNVDHHMFLRVFNRGTVPAYDVRGKIYWSEVSTLPDPGNWKPIGEVGPEDVDAPGPRILGPVTWPASQIPGPGHYCFVATLRSRCEEEPALGSGATWNDYVDFVRGKNGVVWRNFNVPDLSASMDGGGGGFFRFPFEFGGAFDRPRRMRLDLHARLGVGTRMILLVPATLAKLTGARRPTRDELKRWRIAKDQVVVDVEARRHRLFDALIGAKTRGRIEVIVEVKDRDAQRRIGEVAAIQSWGKLELGRVTWRLMSKPRGPDLKQG